MITFIKKFFQSTEQEDLIEGSVFAFANKLLELQERIEKLENENVGLTNALYECENRLESRIDNIHPIIYNINSTEN
jgi:hypothetical protein